MKGICLAGGAGSRLLPMTRIYNKHVTCLYDRPMIYYPLETLRRSGVDDVMIIISDPHGKDIVNLIKNGKEFGFKHLEYGFQEGNGGIADALAIAEDFADSERLAVILGDNIFESAFVLLDFSKGAHIFLKEVEDPQRYGVVEFFNNSSQIRSIIEKPIDPPSNCAVTGLYCFDNTVFDKIRTLTPSARNEKEITDVLNLYLEEQALEFSMIDGWWSDSGTIESLFKSAEFMRNKKLNG